MSSDPSENRSGTFETFAAFNTPREDERASPEATEQRSPSPSDFRSPGYPMSTPFDEDHGTPIDSQGNLFGKYRVIRKLGDGGMGSVWLVEHLVLGRESALKVIKADVAHKPEIRARFEQEARILTMLSRHPNAVTVYDSGMIGNTAYIEMEYLEGKTLREWLTKGEPLPLAKVVWILDQLCDVLEEAHGLGIVHRDIKPENLMVVTDPRAGEQLKVLDFGIAKIVRDVRGNAAPMSMHTEGPLGTYAYSSPEQLGLDRDTEDRPRIDHRSDLYSIGVMLYEMLVGSRPFTGVLTKVLYDHANTPPPPFHEKLPGIQVHPAIEAVVRRCLEKRPEDRPESAQELVRLFRMAVLEAGPLEPEPLVDIDQTAFSERRGPRVQPDGYDSKSTSGRRPSSVFTGPKLTKPLWPPRKTAILGGLVASALVVVGLFAFFVIPIINPYRRPPEWIINWLEKKGFQPSRSKGHVGLGKNGWPKFIERSGENPRIMELKGKYYIPAGYDIPQHAGADEQTGLPDALISQNNEAQFCLIKGTDDRNPFIMGAFSKGLFDDAEKPGHPVCLSSYYIQDSEVTIHQFDRFCKSSFKPDDPEVQAFYDRWKALMGTRFNALEKLRDHPATAVTFKMASRYAGSHGGELPSEAQWEFAARSRGKPRFFVWGDDESGLLPSSRKANIYQSENVWPVEVKSWPEDKTEQGVYDMTGNVREWCRDAWDSYRSVVHECDPVTSPNVWGKQPPYYVIRGGSFDTPREMGRVTWRQDDSGFEYKARDNCPFEDVGFRMVLELLICEPEPGSKPDSGASPEARR
jgi:serine/threonine protein kinase